MPHLDALFILSDGLHFSWQPPKMRLMPSISAVSLACTMHTKWPTIGLSAPAWPRLSAYLCLVASYPLTKIFSPERGKIHNASPWASSSLKTNPASASKEPQQGLLSQITNATACLELESVWMNEHESAHANAPQMPAPNTSTATSSHIIPLR